uniref:SF4 helicase domain-containing protein n=1 Tax=Plectus sambesii TaxID=2011161 RepID=A0A914V0W1_9BILA
MISRSKFILLQCAAKCKARPIVLIKKNKPDAILEAFDHLDSVKTKNIFELTELRQSVKNEIVNHKELMAGIAQFKRFPLLNDYLIGFRPGELTTLTGPTGSGKTTFMCENMVDFMSQGVRTLLCSFEMKTEKVLKWMEVQYTGLPLHQQKYQSDVDVWMDKFERTSGKLYVMNVDAYIGKTVKEVADAIRSQVETARIQHIVIDNLQYLMGSTISTSNKPSTFDKFDRQNEFLRQLRLIAND